MEIAILGQKQSGKSTIFEIMTGIKSREMFGEPTVRGMAKVPDARFDSLVDIFKPAKVSPAHIPFVDINAQGEDAWGTIRKNVAGTDGIVHVVDAFTAKDADEVLSRFRKLEDELIISDLIVVENRLERLLKLPKTALKPYEQIEATLLPKAKDALDSGKPLRELGFTPDEIHALRGFSFWTIRPEIVVVNASENDLSIADDLKLKLDPGPPVIGICGQVEAEIAQLKDDERAPFLEAMGITEPAFQKIIRTAFHSLGQMCYFTVGEDEVKAWVIPAGSTAPRAAAAIHKDFERGFIKAEVCSYADFMNLGKSLASVKSAGRLRLEGKEYIVLDGDIISFRFNV